MSFDEAAEIKAARRLELLAASGQAAVLV